MKLKSVITNESGDILHHAYLIEGEREAVRKELFDFFEGELSIAVRGNPDFLYLTFDSFGIDEGRALKEMQTGKALESAGRFFVVAASSFTHEAQNSLLKVFEDPSPDVYFFVVMPSADGILPTLRSRFFLIEHESKYQPKKAGNTHTASAKDFLGSGNVTRLAFIKALVEEKNKEKAGELIDSIEAELHAQLVGHAAVASPTSSKQNATSLEELARARQYLRDRSSSVKLILEHLALVLPATRSFDSQR